LEERLSRWLLQSRDLLRSNTLLLTQDFLSQMLGVQRSSVTIIARKLQAAGLQDSRCEWYDRSMGIFISSLAGLLTILREISSQITKSRPRRRKTGQPRAHDFISGAKCWRGLLSVRRLWQSAAPAIALISGYQR
jgi:hypothetical protein